MVNIVTLYFIFEITVQILDFWLICTGFNMIADSFCHWGKHLNSALHTTIQIICWRSMVLVLKSYISNWYEKSTQKMCRNILKRHVWYCYLKNISDTSELKDISNWIETNEPSQRIWFVRFAEDMMKNTHNRKHTWNIGIKNILSL